MLNLKQMKKIGLVLLCLFVPIYSYAKLPSSILDKEKWQNYSAQYAPIIYLATDESFFPDFANDFYNGAQKESGYLFYNVGNQPNDAIGQLEGIRPSAQDVPMHVTVVPRNTAAGDTVDIIYWFFYPYNMGKRFDLKPVFDKAYYGNHVGDWEHLTIRFVNDEPTAVYISQHSHGRLIPWADTNSLQHIVDEQGHEHVVAYSAKGSHAVYANVGKHNYFTKKIKVSKHLPVFKTIRLYDHTSQGIRWEGNKSLLIEVPAITQDGRLQWEATWLNYMGRWGNNEQSCPKLFGKGLGFCKLENGPIGPNMKAVLDPNKINFD